MTEHNIVDSYSLSQHVLAVAVLGDSQEDWSAYIYDVLGIDHNLEKCLVARYGDKLSKDIATAMFPGIAKRYIWRT